MAYISRPFLRGWGAAADALNGAARELGHGVRNIFLREPRSPKNNRKKQPCDSFRKLWTRANTKKIPELVQRSSYGDPMSVRLLAATPPPTYPPPPPPCTHKCARSGCLVHVARPFLPAHWGRGHHVTPGGRGFERSSEAAKCPLTDPVKSP